MYVCVCICIYVIHIYIYIYIYIYMYRPLVLRADAGLLRLAPGLGRGALLEAADKGLSTGVGSLILYHIIMLQ